MVGRQKVIASRHRRPISPPYRAATHVSASSPLGANRALPGLPLTGPQQSAKLLLVPPAWLVWSFGGCCDRAAGSKATSGNLGRRRGRLFRPAAASRLLNYRPFEAPVPFKI